MTKDDFIKAVYIQAVSAGLPPEEAYRAAVRAQADYEMLFGNES